MADLQDTIDEVAKGPKSVSTDGTQIQAHDLSDLIEADHHLAAKSASKKPARGLVFTKLNPHGAV